MKAPNHPNWMVIAILTLLAAVASSAGAQPLDDALNPEGFAGIGAVVSANEAGGVAIAAVMPDGPAEKAGVQPGDRIVAVDGVSIEGMELADIVGRIRGREGDNVTLTLQREGRDEPLSVEIKRERIEFGGGLELGGARAGERGGRNERYVPWTPFYERGPEAEPWDGPFGYARPRQAEQPVMVVDGGKIYILRDNVLYKLDAETLEQLGATVLEPPKPER